MTNVITSEMVKILRDRTGGGMMECKKALEQTSGDIEAAVEAMRKSGKAKADKKALRVAAEGIIAVVTDVAEKVALMLEVNCETDFVAKDSNFRQFVDTVANAGLAAKVSDVAALMALTVPTSAGVSKSLAGLREELVAKIGENINVRRVVLLTAVGDGIVGSYVHGGRIGALVSVTAADKTLGRDLAMHVVASHPLAISAEDIPADMVAHEKEIFMAQAQESNKPKEIIEKMVNGKVQKFVDGLVLLKQPFVKNGEMTIADLLKFAKADVLQFIRFEVGEGIDKEKSDFAAEVMAQVEARK
jgi:elongation factor Ts